LKVDFCFLSYVSPDLKIAGGTTHFIQNLSRWCEANDEISVWTTTDAFPLIRHLSGKCDIHLVGLASTSLATSSIGVSIGLVLRTLRSLGLRGSKDHNRKTDFIVAESHFLPDIVAAISLHHRSKNATLITYLHHVVPTPLRRRYHPFLPSTLAWLAQTISLALIKKWRFQIFTFPRVKAELLRLGFPEAKVHCIKNGIDIRRIDTITGYGDDYDGCFLGNTLPRKGILDLPMVWGEVCKEFPDAKLAIIGTGMQKQLDDLRQRFEAIGLGRNVSFLGFLPEKDKIATLKSSRVFLFPSYEEGWGIVVAEAMACGLPVIAYDLPAYREIFHAGMLRVPVGSVAKFADATKAVLRDEEKRVRLGREGRIQAEEYDLEEIAATELHLIKEMGS
jgi:glycosyltransferase involved in cell wall biosynthesis